MGCMYVCTYDVDGLYVQISYQNVNITLPLKLTLALTRAVLIKSRIVCTLMVSHRLILVSSFVSLI